MNKLIVDFFNNLLTIETNKLKL